MTAPATRHRPRAGAGRRIWRWTLLAHRYCGIALGLLVLLWCVSGVIMMYVPYPSLSATERDAGLAVLELSGCCPSPAPEDRHTAVGAHAVEMLGGRPVLRLTDNAAVYDLTAGGWLEPVGLPVIERAGLDHGNRAGFQDPRLVAALDRDQWTVTGQFHRHRPLYRFAAADGHQWYVSSRSAEVVQQTTTGERFWNWLGAVVHWLYPTALRRHPEAWSQTVIWLTLGGLFLTVTGMVIGVAQLRMRRDGRRSPYRGWALWHHYAGLLFGLLTLTWLFSGLLSMNPWGWLEGRSFEREARLLNGDLEPLGAVLGRLALIAREVPEGTRRLERAVWLDQPLYAARDGRGGLVRLDESGAAAMLDVADARAAAAVLRPHDRSANVDLLHGADAYYYAHHDDPRELPVLRLRFADGERLYVSPRSGRLLLAVDADHRASRWLFAALHRGDFHALVRTRPLWDAMMLLALAGVSVGVATGAYLGLRRLLR